MLWNWVNCGWADLFGLPTVPFANTEPYTNSLIFPVVPAAITPKVAKVVSWKAKHVTSVVLPAPAATADTTALIVTPVSVFIKTTVSFWLITFIAWFCPVQGAALSSVGMLTVPRAAAALVTIWQLLYATCNLFCSDQTTWSDVIGISAPTILKKPDKVLFPYLSTSAS